MAGAYGKPFPVRGQNLSIPIPFFDINTSLPWNGTLTGLNGTISIDGANHTALTNIPVQIQSTHTTIADVVGAQSNGSLLVIRANTTSAAYAPDQYVFPFDYNGSFQLPTDVRQFNGTNGTFNTGRPLVDTFGGFTSSDRTLLTNAAATFTSADRTTLSTINSNVQTVFTSGDRTLLTNAAATFTSADRTTLSTINTNVQNVFTSGDRTNLSNILTHTGNANTALSVARNEPGQGAPGVCITLPQKIDFLYKFARNKRTQDTANLTIFADDGTTADHRAAITDSANVTTVGEMGTGA